MKKLRKRDTLLGDYVGTNCPRVAITLAPARLYRVEENKKRRVKQKSLGQYIQEYIHSLKNTRNFDICTKNSIYGTDKNNMGQNNFPTPK